MARKQRIEDQTAKTVHSTGLTRRDFLRGALAAGVVSATASSALAQSGSKSRSRSITPILARQQSRVIEMWMWETEDQWLTVQERAALNEQFPDVEFKWTTLGYSELHQKAVTSLAAGIPAGLPAIMRTHNPYYRALVSTGSLLDVTDQLVPYEDQVIQSVWQEGLIDGRHYHVPDDTVVELLGYRTDIFEAAGLPTDPAEVSELLATMEDFLAVAATIKEKTGANAISMTPDGTMFTALMGQNTTGPFDAEGNIIFDSPVHIEAAEMAKRLWESGLTLELETSGPQLYEAMNEGMLAMQFYRNYYDFVILDNAPETAGKWRVAKLPKLNAESKRATTAPGVGLAIPTIIDPELQALAVEVAIYMKLSERATTAHMRTFPGAFVSYIPGLEAMGNEPSPVLDGQSTYQVFLNAVQEEQPHARLVTSAFESDTSTAINDAMFMILTQDAPVEETLTNAANSIRQLQESRGIK